MSAVVRPSDGTVTVTVDAATFELVRATLANALVRAEDTAEAMAAIGAYPLATVHQADADALADALAATEPTVIQL